MIMNNHRNTTSKDKEYRWGKIPSISIFVLSPRTYVALVKSWRRPHMWVEFIFGSLPCTERFLSGYSGSPLSSKTNISKFQFDQEKYTKNH